MDTTSILLQVTVDHFDETMPVHRAVKRWVDLTGTTQGQRSGRFTNRPTPSVEQDLEERYLVRTMLLAAPEEILSRGRATL